MTDNKISKFLSEGLIIAGITLFSYLVAFSYQAGYASYFQIPLQFITISITTIFISFAYVLGIAVGAYYIFSLIWIFTPKDNDPVSFSIRKLVIVFIFELFIFIPFTKFNWTTVILFFSILIIFIFFEFIFPLITQRKSDNTYAEKLIAQEEIEIYFQKNTLVSEIDKRFGRWFVTSLLYVLLALGYSYAVGYNKAESKEYFYVTDKDTVILAIYNDLLITSKYDRKTKTLNGISNLTKIDQTKNIEISKEKTGKLKVKKII